MYRARDTRLGRDVALKLLPDTYDARHGSLLFVRQGSLLAQHFDVNAKTVTVDAEVVASGVELRGFTGLRSFSVSDTGLLAYGMGTTSRDVGQVLTWIDRNGKVAGTIGPPSNYRGVALSADGRTLAFHRHDGGGETSGRCCCRRASPRG